MEEGKQVKKSIIAAIVVLALLFAVGPMTVGAEAKTYRKIGRASCRERV